jgi:hypothetical protein
MSSLQSVQNILLVNVKPDRDRNTDTHVPPNFALSKKKKLKLL